MKYFYSFLLLISFYQLPAQWSQVGANIGNTGSNAGVSLVFNPITNEPYIAYPDNSTGTIVVQKFNGTSWNQIGLNIGNVAADAGVSLVFNPITNEPYVAYPNNESEAFVVQYFNGNAWFQVGGDIGFAGSDAEVSLAFKPSSNQPYIAYHYYATGTFIVRKLNGSNWSQVGEDIIFSPTNNVTNSYDPDVSLAFNPSTDQPYIAYPQESTNTYIVSDFNQSYWNLVGGTHLGYSESDSSVSVAFKTSTNEVYVAYSEPLGIDKYIKIDKYNGSYWSTIGGSYDLKGSDAAVSLAFNSSSNEPYVAYSNKDLNSFVIQKFDGSSWTQVGSNLGSSDADSGVSLAFNPATNDPYIAYPDQATGTIIVQKFDSNLSLNDLNKNSIKVFPNPTPSELNIQLGGLYKTIKIKIMNSIGKVISTQYFKNKTAVKTDIKLQSGLYFIEVTTDDGNSKIMKIIKN